MEVPSTKRSYLAPQAKFSSLSKFFAVSKFSSQLSAFSSNCGQSKM
jgi:hypothetical protein